MEVAQEAADMVLMTSDLRAVLTAIHLARVIVRRIYLNLLWACAYNVVGIPLAAGLLMPLLHTAIPPYVAGAAMALSSVSVLASSLALKAYRPPRVALSDSGGSGSSSGVEGGPRPHRHRKRGTTWSFASFSSEDGDGGGEVEGEGDDGDDEGLGEATRLLRVVVQEAGAAGGGYGSLQPGSLRI